MKTLAFSPPQPDIDKIQSMFISSAIVHYVSAFKKIGNTYYLLFIYSQNRWNGEEHTFTDYAYFNGTRWDRVENHPQYDSDHSYCGLPKSLAHIYNTKASQEAILKYITSKEVA